MDPTKGDRVIATTDINRHMSGVWIKKGKQGVVVDAPGLFGGQYTVSFDGKTVKNVPRGDIEKV